MHQQKTSTDTVQLCGKVTHEMCPNQSKQELQHEEDNEDEGDSGDDDDDDDDESGGGGEGGDGTVNPAESNVDEVNSTTTCMDNDVLGSSPKETKFSTDCQLALPALSKLAMSMLSGLSGESAFR